MTIVLTETERKVVKDAINEINAHGWCVGAYQAEDGRICGSMALTRAAIRTDIDQCGPIGINIRNKFIEVHGSNIPFFNDRVAERQSDITDALAKLLEE
jgi:hypothetical protein